MRSSNGTPSATAATRLQDPELGKIEIAAIPLKRGQPQWLQQRNSINRVFHAVNGQVQFKQSRGFLTQCGYPALKDRVVVIVDASGLTFEAHNDVWKGDREHVRDTLVGERYKAIVRDVLERSESLKKLQERIAREELTAAAQTQRNDLFQRLVRDDPQIAALLSGRNPSIISRTLDEGDDDPYEGKYSPTFFEFDRKVREQGVTIPLNHGRPVTAKTDVVNDYLHRNDNPGWVVISDDRIADLFTIRQSLLDGRLTLFLTPASDELQPGTSFTFTVGLQDPSMAAALTDTLTIRIGSPKADEDERSKQKAKKKKPTKEVEKPNRGLPPYKLLTKDGEQIDGHPCEQWPADFSELDGGLVQDLGEQGVLYKINYDNAYHMKYRINAKSQVAKEVVTEKYITGMRLLMLGVEHAFREGATNGKDDNGSWVEEYGDVIRRLAARGAASTVLALAEHLPRIAGTAEEPE